MSFVESHALIYNIPLVSKELKEISIDARKIWQNHYHLSFRERIPNLEGRPRNFFLRAYHNKPTYIGLNPFERRVITLIKEGNAPLLNEHLSSYTNQNKFRFLSQDSILDEIHYQAILDLMYE